MRRRTIVAVSILAAGVWAAAQLGLDPRDLWSNAGTTAVLARFFAAAFTPAVVSESGSGAALVPKVLEAMRATVVFAAAGMSVALVGGLVLGFLSSSAWWEDDPVGARNPLVAFLRRRVAPTVTAASRVLIAFMRSIHELLWAMLLLSAFGLSHASAVIAIAIPYAGTLAKVFSELIDEAPRDAAGALRAAGGSPAQIFCIGLLPRTLPDMGAYAFYRFECAMRSSAILGFFGFPTLGYYIALSFENLYYREVWTYLYGLFALVLIMDWWSRALRRRREGFA
jgi:phosphonate transport system permease protein